MILVRQNKVSERIVRDRRLIIIIIETNNEMNVVSKDISTMEIPKINCQSIDNNGDMLTHRLQPL